MSTQPVISKESINASPFPPDAKIEKREIGIGTGIIGTEPFEAPIQLSTLGDKVKAKLNEPTIPHEGVKDIWQMRYKRGNVIHDLSFKVSLTGDLKKDRQRAWDLANRYTKYLGNIDNKKVILIGVPRPLALDLEEEMKNAQVS